MPVVKNPPANARDIRDAGSIPGFGRTPGLEWRRKRQPTSVFFPGKFHGQRSLMGYSPWGCKELDMTEEQSTHTHMCSYKWIKPQMTNTSKKHWQALFTIAKRWKQSTCSSMDELINKTWYVHTVEQCVHACVLSCVHHVPLSMGFSRQEYWSGLPFPPPGDLLGLEVEPTSPALAGRFFPTKPPEKPPQ